MKKVKIKKMEIEEVKTESQILFKLTTYLKDGSEYISFEYDTMSLLAKIDGNLKRGYYHIIE